MLKVTFPFSLKITIDHSPEFSLNVFNRCQSETENTLMTLAVTYFGAQGHYLNKLRRGPLVDPTYQIHLSADLRKGSLRHFNYYYVIDF